MQPTVQFEALHVLGAARSRSVRATLGSRCIGSLVESRDTRKVAMWFLVHVVKGSRHYEAESQIGNQVLISDTSDMVISGRALGTDGYRFEARKGNENFVVGDFPGIQAEGTLEPKFIALAKQIGAVMIADPMKR